MLCKILPQETDVCTKYINVNDDIVHAYIMIMQAYSMLQRIYIEGRSRFPFMRLFMINYVFHCQTPSSLWQKCSFVRFS